MRMVGRGRGGRGGCGGGGRSSGGTGRRSRPLAGGSRPRRTRTARGRARLHRLRVVGSPRPRSPQHGPQLPLLQPHAPPAATLLPRLAVRAALQRSTTTSLLLPRLSRHLATAAAVPQPPDGRRAAARPAALVLQAALAAIMHRVRRPRGKAALRQSARGRHHGKLLYPRSASLSLSCTRRAVTEALSPCSRKW